MYLTRRQVLASERMDEQWWKVGDLAEATGLTVRALHHFDQIGLLQPSQRTVAGHRVYTAGDVRRLYRVLALRQVGMPLGRIAESLEGDVEDLKSAVCAQLANVERQIEVQQQLRRRLAALLRAIEQTTEPSLDELIATMEAMMTASDFTPEQLAQAKERHQEAGFAQRFADWQQHGRQIAQDVQIHIERETDPADPAVQELAWRWTTIMQDMADGDQSVISSMYAKIERKGPEAATRGVLTAPVWDYLKRAFAVGFGARR